MNNAREGHHNTQARAIVSEPAGLGRFNGGKKTLSQAKAPQDETKLTTLSEHSYFGQL